ncbi:MAG: GntR family transcriptional regulator [Anaerolineae bacterium]
MATRSSPNHSLLFEPLAVLNLRDHIEEKLRAAILRGTFKPGDHLVETLIAEQLGVSRAPVREALSALERAGLVVCVPRKGYFVIDFTEKDVEEIYSLRLLLELEALRRAISRITEADLDELQALVHQLDASARRMEAPEETVALDLSFHGHICKLADHERLLFCWNNLRAQAQLLVGVTTKTHYDHPEEPGKLHQAILDAIRAQDLARAEQVLTVHLEDAQRRAIAALRSLHRSEETG